jgi:hypothetical protein
MKMTNQITTKPEILQYLGKKWEVEELEHELAHYLLKATQSVMRNIGCNRQVALAYICRDWMEYKGVPVVDPNPLRPPAPIPQPPSAVPSLEDMEVRPDHRPSFLGLFRGTPN